MQKSKQSKLTLFLFSQTELHVESLVNCTEIQDFDGFGLGNKKQILPQSKYRKNKRDIPFLDTL